MSLRHQELRNTVPCPWFAVNFEIPSLVLGSRRTSKYRPNVQCAMCIRNAFVRIARTEPRARSPKANALGECASAQERSTRTAEGGTHGKGGTAHAAKRQRTKGNRKDRHPVCHRIAAPDAATAPEGATAPEPAATREPPTAPDRLRLTLLRDRRTAGFAAAAAPQPPAGAPDQALAQSGSARVVEPANRSSQRKLWKCRKNTENVENGGDATRRRGAQIKSQKGRQKPRSNPGKTEHHKVRALSCRFSAREPGGTRELDNTGGARANRVARK